MGIFYEVIDDFTPAPVKDVPALPTQTHEKELQAAIAELRAAEIVHDRLVDRRKVVLINSNPADAAKDLEPIEAELAIARKKIQDAAAKREALRKSAGPKVEEILAA